VPLYLEVLLWLIFGSFAAAVAIYVALLAWATARIVGRGRPFGRRAPAMHELPIPAAGTFVLRTDGVGVGLIWNSLLILLPLLALALWAVAVEFGARTLGTGLVFALIHVLLIWQMIRIGTRVQRVVEISRSSLVVHPVFGRGRELNWSAIARVDDVVYTGPGVSGLYLYDRDGSQVVLDRWLPHWDALKYTVRQLTLHAEWNTKHRAALG
jgi:hypothetical protein